MVEGGERGRELWDQVNLEKERMRDERRMDREHLARRGKTREVRDSTTWNVRLKVLLCQKRESVHPDTACGQCLVNPMPKGKEEKRVKQVVILFVGGRVSTDY